MRRVQLRLKWRRRNICVIYGKNFINKMTVNRCFACFREANFELSDATWSEDPVKFDEECLVDLLQKTIIKWLKNWQSRWDVTRVQLSVISNKWEKFKNFMGPTWAKTKQQKSGIFKMSFVIVIKICMIRKIFAE